MYICVLCFVLLLLFITEVEAFRRLREEFGQKRNERLEKEQQLKREQEEWKQQRENLCRERERLARELEQQARDSESHHEQQVNQLTRTLTTAQQELEHEKEQRQAAQQQVRDLESHHQQQVNQLTRTLTTARQELEHEKEQRQTSEQEARELENRLQVQQHQVSELTTTVRRTQQSLEQEREERQRTQQSLEQEREVRQRTQQSLEQEREERQRTEQHSRDLEGRVTELATTLATAQQAIEEYRRSESRDWIISRDEVRMSDRSLGEGGWGAVFEGTFRGTQVAVKQIHALIVSPYNRRLFEREMNMASRCRHPCLLQFIGATNDDTSPLFVTELMETSLRAVLHERSLTSREILVISTDVARALNYLHLNRPTPIIHRDISGGNVLLWQQGEVWRGKVSDYGTANFVRREMTAAPGTAAYSAPEALTSTQSPKVGFRVCFGCDVITKQAGALNGGRM